MPLFFEFFPFSALRSSRLPVRGIGLALFLLLLPAVVRSATPSEEAGALLLQAQENLRNGRLAPARQNLQSIILGYAAHRNMTEQAGLLLGITQYLQGDFAAAERQLVFFGKNYPQSIWLDQSRYYLGKALFRRGERDKGRACLSELLGRSADTRLRQRIQRYFFPASVNGAPSPGERKAAQAIPRIGLLCPLTGEQRIFGEALLRGAIVAITAYNRTHARSVQLIVENTQERQLAALAGARRLIDDGRVLGLVGPLTSSTTITVGLLAQEQGVALVAPTATEYGITGLGNCLTQLNVPTEVQGELVAEMAMRELKYRTFAILAPRDDYGQALTRGFERKALELGGTVVAREWYYEGTADFSSQFKKIRRRELIKALNLMNVAADTDVEKIAMGRWSDKDRTAANDKKKNDDEGPVALRSIDAFFVPAYVDEAPLVASQIAFNKLDAAILGGDKWNDDGILKEKSCVEGAVFPVLVRRDKQSAPYQDFFRIYNEKYKEPPGDPVLLGYDAVRFMLVAAGAEGATREKVRATLQDVREFEGVGRTLEFPAAEHYNRHLDFGMVKNGKIVPFVPVK